VLLDPDQPLAWRDALLGLLDDPGRRAALAHAGLERARTFTWDRTAGDLTTIYLAASRAESARS
jgi:D-inositol-3-phosphate glycosyltransferase